MHTGGEEIGAVALLAAVGLAALWGLLTLYERALCWVRLTTREGQKDTMLRKKTNDNLPAVQGHDNLPAVQGRDNQAAPTTLDLIAQMGRGQGSGVIDGVAAVLAARHEAALEERMLEQVERRLVHRQRLAEGVGKTVGAEDGAKQVLHSSQINDIRRRRELQAELDGPPPPQPVIAPPAASAPAWPPPLSTPPVMRPMDPDDAELRRLANDACILIAQSSDPAQAWAVYKHHLTHGSGYAYNVRQELEELVQARLAVMGVRC